MHVSTELVTAIVALLVSAIALIIASLQLIQAVSGTAEGYKRCAPSVIGSWAELRTRKYHWKEFRFEVQYTAPNFMLISPDDGKFLTDRERESHGPRESSADSRHNVHILHSRVIEQRKNEAEQRSRLLKGTPNKLQQLWRWIRYNPSSYATKTRILHSAVEGVSVVQTQKSEEQDNVERVDGDPRDQIRIVEDSIKPGLVRRVSTFIFPGKYLSNKRLQRADTMPRASSNRAPDPSYEAKVSWTLFLREVCTVFNALDPHPDAREMSNHETRDDPSISLEPRVNAYEAWNFARTDAAITFRRWSWDVLPPDMTRPLATIAVGHLVILAVRLGMEWRTLNLENGMLADGEGFSLSGTRTDRLGLVFRFSYTAGRHRLVKLIPNKATNKLICGRLPGCPNMVNRDFAIVDNARKSLLDLSRVLEPGHVLSEIGVPGPTRAILLAGVANHQTYPSIHNEIVPLLCTYLPIDSCDNIHHPSYCWTENQKSVFHFWEGRHLLLSKLQERTKKTPCHPHIHESHEWLQKLRSKKYTADFYGKKNGRVFDRTDDAGIVLRRCFLIVCKDIYRWSDAVFDEWNFKVEDEQARTQYQNLVAAHLNMAIHATTESYRKKDEELPSCAIEDDTMAATEPGLYRIVQNARTLRVEAARPSWVVYRILDVANRYVTSVQDPKIGISWYMKQRQSERSDEELEAAWWMLMVRGIAWDMSTIASDRGEPIPASFYNNHTPVWIT